MTAGDSKAAVRGEVNMKSRPVMFTVVVAAAVLLLGGVCGRRLDPPEFISVPGEVYAGDTVWARLAASGRGHDSVRYVVNWDDVTDTTPPFGLLDTASVWHIYTAAPDTKYVRAAVYAPDDPQGIEWVGYEPVVVVEPGGPHAPLVDSVLCPPVAVRGETTWFVLYAHDPDNDSVRAVAAWNDSMSTTTDFFPGPATMTVSHVFEEVETAVVAIVAQDIHGAVSLSDTILVPVGYAGAPFAPWPKRQYAFRNTRHVAVEGR